jgi:16S rRNA (adenine1518-N6/adenine1519-N6)-dimethyltransferase
MSGIFLLTNNAMTSYLGQNFLKNQAIIEAIVNEWSETKNQLIIEIGPGKGALTDPMSVLCKKNNNTLVAIEKDKRLALKMYERKLPNTEIEYGDIRILLPKIVNKIGDEKTYNIVGNIPYYLTGFLLRILGDLSIKPKKTVLMVQKEVGERMIATPPKMNKLAAAIQIWAQAEKICFVPKKDFSPVPKVDSMVIRLLLNDDNKIEKEFYYETVNALFQQPRKTIENNLHAFLVKIYKKQHSREITKNILKNMEIPENQRPQNLSIEDIKKISQYLCNTIKEPIG